MVLKSLYINIKCLLVCKSKFDGCKFQPYIITQQMWRFGIVNRKSGYFCSKIKRFLGGRCSPLPSHKSHPTRDLHWLAKTLTQLHMDCNFGVEQTPKSERIQVDGIFSQPTASRLAYYTHTFCMVIYKQWTKKSFKNESDREIERKQKENKEKKTWTIFWSAK